MGDEFCTCDITHKERIESVRSKLPQEETLYDLAEFFKVFGDTTRVKILAVLLETELCVCDIAELLGISQSAISHQLRVLRQARLVKPRKEGKVVFYALDDVHIKHVFDQGLEHILEPRGGFHCNI